jgi:hypothetical protein
MLTTMPGLLAPTTSWLPVSCLRRRYADSHCIAPHLLQLAFVCQACTRRCASSVRCACQTRDQLVALQSCTLPVPACTAALLQGVSCSRSETCAHAQGVRAASVRQSLTAKATARTQAHVSFANATYYVWIDTGRRIGNTHQLASSAIIEPLRPLQLPHRQFTIRRQCSYVCRR